MTRQAAFFGHTAPAGPQTSLVPIVTAIARQADTVSGENQQSAQPPSIVTSATSILTDAAASTSITVDLPGSIVSGNTLLAFVAHDGNGTTTWPAGWTKLFDHASNATVRLSAAWRKADGGEGASITVTNTQAQPAASQVFQIQSAADPTVAPPVYALTQSTTDAPNPPVLNPAAGSNNYLWFAATAMQVPAAGLDISAGPANYLNFAYNESGNTDRDVGCAVASRANEAGSEDPGLFTASTSSEWVATTVAVTPSGEAGSTPNQIAVPTVTVGAGPQTINPSQAGGVSPYFECDCSSFTSDAALHSVMGTTTTGNVHADFGVGMRYDYQPKPLQCSDQTLASIKNLPDGTDEVWIRLRMKWSSNWSTENANCTSPIADHKTILAFLDGNTNQGQNRFGFHVGYDGDKYECNAPGFPQADVVPINHLRVAGAGALFDNQFHLVELHWELVDDNTTLYQAKVDGNVVNNIQTDTTTGLSSRDIQDVRFGANRNLGATELMHIWWDDIKIFTSDPGDMSFPSPSIWT